MASATNVFRWGCGVSGRDRPRLAARAAMGLVRVYQLTLSPAKRALFGPGCGCRFHPTCSSYALEALRLHGFLRGSVMALWRILRCHPFHPGGYDPVRGSQEDLCRHSCDDSTVE